MSKQKRDIYQDITNRVIEALERGVNPWRKPWTSEPGSSGAPHNANTGRPYRGINTLLLMIEQMDKGYQSTGWITPKAAMAAELSFKGQKCTQVVFCKQGKSVDKATGEETGKTFMWAKTYNVLNLDQCEGDKSKLKGVDSLVEFTESTPSDLARTITEAVGVSLTH